MIITPLPVTIPYPKSKTPRSPGLHLSGIIRGIAQDTGLLDKLEAESLSLIEVNGEDWWATLDEPTKLRIALGLAWEQLYIPMLEEGGVVDHPEELCVDGIYMSRDGESVDVVMHESRPDYWEALYVPALIEVKATFKSVNTVSDIQSQWMWMSQMMGYAHAMDTLVAYLHCLCIVGDYKTKKMSSPFGKSLGVWDIEPRLLKWKFEFTEYELERNWDLMRDYARSKGHLLPTDEQLACIAKRGLRGHGQENQD